jgi:anthranilate phosphoribosyltransferase
MKSILTSVMRGEILETERAEFALKVILSGELPAAQTVAFLTAIQMRGVHLSELRGFHSVLRESGITIDLQEEKMIDVCGTGGDGKGTFNISTLAAFVLAGAGVKVAKHGNASATSGSGSSDILAHLGVKFTIDEEALRRQVREANICYLHAPLFQPILKAVAPIRKDIGFRTLFNLLGPLINPARPSHQFIGVAEPSVLRLYRYFLEDGDAEFALVNTRDGYDEISLTGAFDVVTNDGAEVYYPEDIGFETVAAVDLKSKDGLDEIAQDFLNVLQNNASQPAQTKVILANAAFAMRFMNKELSIYDCQALAQESLDSGAAMRAFEYLRDN